MVIFVKKDKDVPSLGRIGSFLDKQRLGCTNNLSKKFKFLFLRKIVAEGGLGLSINLSFQHRGNHGKGIAQNNGAIFFFTAMRSTFFGFMLVCNPRCFNGALTKLVADTGSPPAQDLAMHSAARFRPFM